MSKKHKKNHSYPQKSNPITAIQTKETFQGPLPHPNILEGYEKVLPGSAERILTLTEKQADHRMKMELQVIESNNRNSRRGVMYAFIIAMTAIIGGIIIILFNKNTEGLSIIIACLVALIGVFISGRYFEKKERDKKINLLQNQ